MLRSWQQLQVPRDRKGAFLLLTLATLKLATSSREGKRERDTNGPVKMVLRSECQLETQGKKMSVV